MSILALIMQAKVTKQEQALLLMRERGLTRPRDLREHGISREHLRRLRERGLIVQGGRGLYLPAEAEASEHHGLALASRRVPLGVVCLLSALRYHGFTSQEPHEVWLALATRAHQPRVDHPPLRTVRMSEESLSQGVEEHEIEKVPVRIFGAAKTVADCFKYRSTVGLDVALEALREGWRARLFSMDELWHFARVCRVANVMRPYVEAVVAS